MAATVLVVDDDATCLMRCRAALEAADIPVACATSAEDALAWFGGDPDFRRDCALVLCDYLMPGRNGLSLFCELRGRRPDLSGILLTGHASLPVAVEALNRGFSQVLTKPVESVGLVEAVELTLREQRVRRENARLSAITHLYDALRSLTRLTDSGELAQAIVELAVAETTADAASLMLLEPTRRVLRLAAGVGLDPRRVGHTEVALGEPIAGWVLERGVSLELAAGRPIPALIRAAMNRQALQAGVVVPLVPAGQPLGVLSVSWRVGTAGFGPGDVELVGVLAADAAHLLQRAGHQQERLRDERVSTIGRLASSIIHDLRTPVTVIRGAAELLAELDPAWSGPLARIASQAGDLDHMCELLLSFARETESHAGETYTVAELLAGLPGDRRRLHVDLADDAAEVILCGWRSELARVLGDVATGAPTATHLTIRRQSPGICMDLGLPGEPDDNFEVSLILLSHVVERMGGAVVALSEPARHGVRVSLPQFAAAA